VRPDLQPDRPTRVVAKRSRNLLGGILVLVVEDHPDARDLFRSMLECHGAIVTVAASVDEAKRILEVLRPHVIVTDIGLRQKPGTYLLDYVRESPSFALTPVIGVTGRHVPPTVKATFDAFIEKPADMDELCSTVLRLVNQQFSRKGAG
jgi:CheY-like chemotaxis protein